jgi:hypothetical protein
VVDFDRVRAALSRLDLGGASQAQDLARDVQPLDAEGTLVDASERLWRDDAEQLPVVGPDGTLLGVLTRRDLLAAIDTELLRRNVMLAKVRWRDDAGTVTDFFELPRGQRLEQVQVPPGLVGRTLEQAALGRQRGVNVLAVVRHAPDGGSERFAPRAADLLADGDVLVVLGTEEAIDALRAEGGV